MTDELGPAARALLDAARPGLAPDPTTVARMRTKLDSSIAASAGGAIATKLGLLALVLAVATGALLYGAEGARRDRSLAAEQVPANEPANDPAFGRESLVPAPATTRDPAPPRAIEDTAAPAPIVHASTPAMVPATSSTPPITHRPPRHPVAHADLGREVELIDRAMAAMRAGDAAAALAAVRAHASETAGAGQLAEDAAAIEIEALCRLHDGSAGKRLAAFDARWPDSAQRSRLSSSCR
ncbi:MAG: hypothetical protein H6Q90_6150 [Deltaproteobacteria bacterium]|nr:hypothetical protein [Deltaproteobacteria bacterium]